MPSLRALLVLLAVPVAWSCGDGRLASGAAPTAIGPDAVLLRLPIEGGLARAHRVGSDSTLWQSRVRAPATEQMLGFDEFLGLLISQDRTGQVLALDLRLGTLDTLSQERIGGRIVSEGGAAYSLDSMGRVIRVTPAGTWTWPPPGGATDLVPHPDGSLLVLTDSGARTIIRRLIPPETRITDSASLPRVRLTARTDAGDRLWAVTSAGIISLRSRDLEQAFTYRLRDSVVALALTPSGDRLFVATNSELRIVDRYAERERGSIDLPAPVSALRMDPDGHYLLAKARDSDSVHVISIGTNRIVSTVATPWRRDLPLITPDGRILVVRGTHAVLLDAESSRERLVYRGGATDEWALVRWNGFRPRAAGLDRPVEFEEFAADSARTDSALTAMIAARYGDLSGIAKAAPLASPDAPAPDAAQRPAGALRGTWTVSFATLLTEERAHAMADSIVVDGRTARVVPGNRDGVPVWRVLLGPFNSRQEAERAGMRSRLSYWVFEGMP